MEERIFKASYLLTEEGNPYIKKENQKARYAKEIWPIPELREAEDNTECINYVDDKIGDALAAIAFAIHDAREEARLARKKAAMSREEIRQEFEAEIEGLEAQLNNSLAIFSDLEMERYEKFYQKHFKLHYDGSYMKDPGIIFHMIGTGVGMCYTIECPICHEKEDITDVSSW